MQDESGVDQESFPNGKSHSGIEPGRFLEKLPAQPDPPSTLAEKSTETISELSLEKRNAAKAFLKLIRRCANTGGWEPEASEKEGLWTMLEVLALTSENDNTKLDAVKTLVALRDQDLKSVVLVGELLKTEREGGFGDTDGGDYAELSLKVRKNNPSVEQFDSILGGLKNDDSGEQESGGEGG